MRSRGAKIVLSLVVMTIVNPVACGAEHKWPEGYTIAGGSESPDGRYGVLLPPVDEAGDEEDEVANELVDLKSKVRLGAIQGAHYFPGRNHRGLSVTWAKDSAWAIVVYEGRFGFNVITLIEPRGDSFAQTDLGKHVQASLDRVIARQSGKAKDGGDAYAFFRAAPGNAIHVRATAETNPKRLADHPNHCARFQGTFDVRAKKWLRSEARKVTEAEAEALNVGYADVEGEEIAFADAEGRLQTLDRRLNDVYRAVRTALPAERFAAVKKEQIAWLKELEGMKSEEKKGDFIFARINVLRELLWD